MVADGPDSLARLLKRLSSGDTDFDSLPRPRMLLAVLKHKEIETGSQFLARTDSALGISELQDDMQEAAFANGWRIGFPMTLVPSLRMAVMDMRLSLVFADKACRRPILFTAPHALHLKREGYPTHKPEAYTAIFAKHFAHSVDGAFLTWADPERERSRARARKGEEPDPTNQDPNFTHRDYLHDSPWTRNLYEVREIFQSAMSKSCLHVDLHGCKDPSPEGGSHLVVGLRAMALKFGAANEELKAWRSDLHKLLSTALRGVSVNVNPEKQLTGALDGDYCTLTQQSLTVHGGSWTHAVQVEMSFQLRATLWKDESDHGLRFLLAQAIYLAWAISTHQADEKLLDRALKFFDKCGEFYSIWPNALASGKSSSPQKCSKSAKSKLKLDEAEDADDNDEDLQEDTFKGDKGHTANNEATPSPLNEPFESVKYRFLYLAHALTNDLLVPTDRYPNLARNRPSEASSIKSEERSAGNAVDEKFETRWTSLYEDDQWFIVDLGSPYDLWRVEVCWEHAHPQSYDVCGSLDGKSWSTFVEGERGREGWACTSLPVNSKARWVKLAMHKRATAFGNSIWQLRVHERRRQDKVFSPPSRAAKQEALGEADCPLVAKSRAMGVERISDLREWLKTDCDTAGHPLAKKKAPRDQFHLAGTFNGWRNAEAMQWDGHRFYAFVTVSEEGWESFQIWLDGKSDSSIHPNIADAHPYTKHAIMGPDSKGHGLNWTIGIAPSSKDPATRPANPGECYKVTVVADDTVRPARALSVKWELHSQKGTK
eukprot:gnl/TRDRNA2_/TRDRNA2_167976_c0_seq1.p1 gnl/TRDRNA2_/TRDRNA2_167976_c0~~gnl/TRDRNA2_/TRDRNA2_167976_c0_seq1.p1  ORF type:complete len:771 (-),score=124.82 gnl/TRDRNA2_/TRDRNA2_167976_c0_seq1:144-2456(-)